MNILRLFMITAFLMAFAIFMDAIPASAKDSNNSDFYVGGAIKPMRAK